MLVERNAADPWGLQMRAVTRRWWSSDRRGGREHRLRDAAIFAHSRVSARSPSPLTPLLGASAQHFVHFVLLTPPFVVASSRPTLARDTPTENSSHQRHEQRPRRGAYTQTPRQDSNTVSESWELDCRPFRRNILSSRPDHTFFPRATPLNLAANACSWLQSAPRTPRRSVA